MSRRKLHRKPTTSWRDLKARIPSDYEFHLQRIPDDIREKLAEVWSDLQRNGAIVARRERDRHPSYRLRVRVAHPEFGQVHRSIALPRRAVRGASILCLAFRIERMRQAEIKRHRKRELERQIRLEKLWLRIARNSQKGEPEDLESRLELWEAKHRERFTDDESNVPEVSVHGSLWSRMPREDVSGAASEAVETERLDVPESALHAKAADAPEKEPEEVAGVVSHAHGDHASRPRLASEAAVHG